MTETDPCWSLSNAGSVPLSIWLEPWPNEFEVPPRSHIILKPRRFVGGCPFEIEQTADHVVVWSNAPLVEVFIDGVLQDSGSACIPVPAGLTRDMLQVAFGGSPSARLGGAAPASPRRPSLWGRLKARFGF